MTIVNVRGVDFEVEYTYTGSLGVDEPAMVELTDVRCRANLVGIFDGNVDWFDEIETKLLTMERYG